MQGNLVRAPGRAENTPFAAEIGQVELEAAQQLKVICMRSRSISARDAPDHFGLAICALICYLPLGIIAIINASSWF